MSMMTRRLLRRSSETIRGNGTMNMQRDGCYHGNTRNGLWTRKLRPAGRGRDKRGMHAGLA